MHQVTASGHRKVPRPLACILPATSGPPRSKRPLILLVVPIALVQAPNDFFTHLGITCDRDNHAVLCDDIAVFCLDREYDYGAANNTPAMHEARILVSAGACELPYQGFPANLIHGRLGYLRGYTRGLHR